MAASIDTIIIMLHSINKLLLSNREKMSRGEGNNFVVRITKRHSVWMGMVIGWTALMYTHTLYLSLYIYLSLSITLSLSLYHSLSLSITLSLFLSFLVSFSLSITLSLSFHHSLSLSLFIFTLYISFYHTLSLSLSINLYLFLSHTKATTTAATTIWYPRYKWKFIEIDSRRQQQKMWK